jgi:hypothetical protein
MPRKKKEAPAVKAPVRINAEVSKELIPGQMSAAEVCNQRENPNEVGMDYSAFQPGLIIEA